MATIRFSDVVAAANATAQESGVPANDAGAESDDRPEAIWFIGLANEAHTATLQPWLWNAGRRRWHKVGDTIDIVGSDTVLVYTGGPDSRTFIQVTDASNYPITRDVLHIAKEA